MSFEWEKYESSGGAYIDAAEKKVIRDNGIPLEVLSIREEQADENRFDQHRFVLKVMAPDPETGEPEERLLTFPVGSGVESRDRLLGALAAHLEETGETALIKIDRKGKSDLVVPASAGSDEGE